MLLVVVALEYKLDGVLPQHGLVPRKHVARVSLVLETHHMLTLLQQALQFLLQSLVTFFAFSQQLIEFIIPQDQHLLTFEFYL